MSSLGNGGLSLAAVLVAVAGIVGLLGYVRLAPSDPARWHVAPVPGPDRDLAGGAVRNLPGVSLAQLDRVARDWPRTRVLAGSVEGGMITYATRSAMIGFPDYTTVQAVRGGLLAHARLRFGSSDLGVNGKRLDAWIARLGQE